MTERLYYDDPHSTEFDATVVRIAPRDRQRAVWLDRSSFYPTSGGQPFDTGSLGSNRVVDVEDDDDGDVVHVVEGSGPLEVGQRVHGVVDVARRLDHIQQHSGQHVLSAAIVRLLGVPTVSFHLGADTTTIDVARELTAGEMARVEDEANRVVWEDRPVSIRYASAEEAAAMPLRKEPVRTGRLRLIDIENFDLSACGGTHVRRTGEIGVIAIAGWERFKGGQRIEFLCGRRALTRFRMLRDSTTAAVRLLSVLPADLAGAIERLQADAKEQKRSMGALQLELARHQAVEFAAQAETHARGRLILKILDLDANGLKTLALSIVSAPGFIVILVSRSAPALIVAARSADIAVSCQEIVAAMTGQFGGRGGGKPDLAQGGGLNASPEAVLDALRQWLG